MCTNTLQTLIDLYRLSHHPNSADPQLDAHAQQSNYAADDDMTDFLYRVVNRGEHRRQSLRNAQLGLTPDGFLPDQQPHHLLLEDFVPRVTPEARAKEEAAAKAGIPLETQEQIAARVEELMKDKPISDKDFANMALGNGGNGGSVINQGQRITFQIDNSTATGTNDRIAEAPHGPMLGLTANDFLATRKEHSDFAIRNGETPPSYAYTGASRPNISPTPTSAPAKDDDAFAAAEASALRRLMGEVDPERLALYDRKLESERKQKAEAAKKELCKEYDDLMDRNMHDMSHYEGCNCNAWVRFELDAGDEVDDWDANMAANAQLDEEIYQLFKRAEEIEEKRSGRL